MYICGVSLNSISMINLVMAIGFAVDYSAHVAHSFVFSTENNPEQKVIEALRTTGASVIMGGRCFTNSYRIVSYRILSLPMFVSPPLNNYILKWFESQIYTYDFPIRQLLSLKFFSLRFQYVPRNVGISFCVFRDFPNFLQNVCRNCCSRSVSRSLFPTSMAIHLLSLAYKRTPWRWW